MQTMQEKDGWREAEVSAEAEKTHVEWLSSRKPINIT